ncbi:DNA repair protein RadA [Deferribacter desulfuricans SSM1]|uniref:DNA repair protein RadA n=1 Tax=Deferribacter desulfuricans (strain DSM 14783 / JCM 11476 / NBRC 101012 / SSM1) TaxID=639282 RepID=D3P973_DEFDS|nr:DNA repair protein RadA [Deferribacter desulfuricans]BAI81263.1 DNA repair protein RadA [Deferribacter desulfuricans SSM1]
MKKSKTSFVCQVCGYKTPKWVGKCSECGSWNSFVEEIEESKSEIRKKRNGLEIKRISDIEGVETERFSTGINEFDQVLGGGVVKGGVVLIGGEPGIGKSTIMLQISDKLSKHGKRVIYFSGEESLTQLKLRCDRLNINGDELFFSATNNIEDVLDSLSDKRADVIIIDSIQTIYSSEISSAAGTVSQVKYVTHKLVEFAKSKGVSVFIVGQVTKDGVIAGPKVLEHLVDTVLYFEGDYERGLRILRAVKNRFGSTNEVGLFEMSGKGLIEYRSSSFIDNNSDAPGRALTVVMEGTRAFLVEIQALVSQTYFNYPKRNVTGFDLNRLNMLLAILEKKCGFNLSTCDVYLNIVGGLKITEPSVDLAVCAAIISSFRDIAIEKNAVFLGEVGLTGEVRTPVFLDMRINEAKRFNIKKIIGNMNNVSDKSVELFAIKHINEITNYI